MKLIHLMETPITDLDTIGDFERNSSFRHRGDRALVTRPAAIKRLHQTFDNTSHDFNLYFVNSPKANRHTEVGLVSLDWVRDELGDEVAERIRLDGDAIVVIFTNNKGSNRSPLTPWIIAHRIAHAMQRPDWTGGLQMRLRYQNEPFRYAHEQLMVGIGDILQYHYGIGAFDTRNVLSMVERDRRAQLAVKHFCQAVCTFKSARDGKVREWFEMVNELFAQYVTTGRIRFNAAPASFGGRDKYYRRNTGDDPNDELGTLSRTMDYLFNDALNAAIGKIHVM